jgi:hypothetical protein
MKKPTTPAIIDARLLFKTGVEPFPRIKAASEALVPGQTLIVVTPFLPSPLIERLQASGFCAAVSHRQDGAWETHFTRQ